MAKDFTQVTLSIDTLEDITKLADRWTKDHDGVELTPHGMIKVLIKNYTESLGQTKVS